ncbi:hypothetical protein ESCO_005562 [Escovopsis weberi]|uniref:Uncharacterized protein n=1 Tax=Escovopsis weberi TaxID=150374 RepID=A0A0M8N4Q9_ESCWE|nr:hypothetical protein ESCO_005562 [Escovopsis weberi]
MDRPGRQSPSPERQSGAQLHDPPASGQGLGPIKNKEQLLKDQIAVYLPAYLVTFLLPLLCLALMLEILVISFWNIYCA